MVSGPMTVAVKVAVQVLAASRVTVPSAAQFPPQPTKMERGSGIAVRLTGVPLA